MIGALTGSRLPDFTSTETARIEGFGKTLVKENVLTRSAS
jgi:hypothetical protein